MQKSVDDFDAVAPPERNSEARLVVADADAATAAASARKAKLTPTLPLLILLLREGHRCAHFQSLSPLLLLLCCRRCRLCRSPGGAGLVLARTLLHGGAQARTGVRCLRASRVSTVQIVPTSSFVLTDVDRLVDVEIHFQVERSILMALFRR